MAQIEALLLDVGGTLYENDEFDQQFGTVLDNYLAARLEVSRSAARELLRSRMAELEASEGDPSKVRAMASFGIGRERVHELFAQVNPQDYLGPEPSTVDAIADIARSGVRLAVLSNFKTELVQRILCQIRVSADLFEFMITEDDGLPIKPSLIPFKAALQRFGLPAKKVGYVGDSLSKDIRPASALGYTTFWVNAGKRQDEHATHTITNLAELLPLVQASTESLQND